MLLFMELIQFVKRMIIRVTWLTGFLELTV